jgi:hypothetical protein
MLIFSKPALLVTWISLLFDILQRIMVCPATIYLVPKVTQIKVNRRGENNLSAGENKSLKSQYSGYRFYMVRYAPNQHVPGKLSPIDIPVYGFSEFGVFQ